MSNKYLHILALLFASNVVTAQQFIGSSWGDYTGIQLMPYNPAWVNSSEDGVEFQPFSISELAGTNAYLFNKGWVLSGARGQAIEGADYKRDKKNYIKHVWGNKDVLGPAISFTINRQHHIGIYTRYRQIARGGNLSSGELELIGDLNNPLLFKQPITVNNAGFTYQAFGEIGFTYGKILRNDDFHFLKAGATIKYIAGFSAASVYTKSYTYERLNDDSIASLKGDLTAVYTYNLDPFIDKDASNDQSAWGDRAGKGSLGLDLGFQYEYHPNGNPNERTQYLFSIAASLTDIGAVRYVADTGSGNYEVLTGKRPVKDIERRADEEVGWYFVRQVKDSVLYVNEDYQKFKVGLPTAFRFNWDWNVVPKFNLAANIMMNLKGNNGTVYNPGYIGYLNITPSYGVKALRVGMPLTFFGKQNVGLGVSLRLGPLYLGSTSLLSSVIMSKQWIRNIDGYIGLTFKLKKEEDYYRYR